MLLVSGFGAVVVRTKFISGSTVGDILFYMKEL